MSSNYFFQKWRNTLSKLSELVRLDVEYQETKAHDKKWCDAVERLTGILGMYMFIYNEANDCYQHNLQVQKTEFIEDVIKAIVSRIIELKEQLRKLIASEYQFMGHGLTKHKLTTFDIEVSDIPFRHERSQDINALILQAFQKAKERGEKMLKDEITDTEPENELLQKVKWWEDVTEDTSNVNPKGINIMAIYELKKKEDTVVTSEMHKMVALIQAHERSRKQTVLLRYHKQRLERWVKELNGTLQPSARHELREKSAKLIQNVIRAYFLAKRNRVKDCKRDEMLQLRLCEKDYRKGAKTVDLEIIEKYNEKFKKNKEQWLEHCEKIKHNFLERNRNDIEDDIRDEIMSWFRRWFDEARFFHDIPKEIQGGSVFIVKEELPSPAEWLEKYEVYLEEKRKNKNKTAYEKKYERAEAKRELRAEKRAEQLKKKQEEKLLNKLMKNPNYHPGYYYPESKKTECVFTAIKQYQKEWRELDVYEATGVKEKFVVDFDKSNIFMNIKIETRKIVDEDMRGTLKILRNALKVDYERNDEKMPEQIKEKTKRKKKKRKYKMEPSEAIADKLEDLAFRGFLKDYPKIRIGDFLGDYNFAGDDFRCALKSPNVCGGETRGLWWERCRALNHGCHRILLVGPKGSGKATLVRALASVNDAVLYEVDPASFPEELFSAGYLQQLANSIGTCAKATQPSVIFIRHIHRLNYDKVPPGEDIENLNLIKRYLVRKLLKRIQKTDKITIVASCTDPWLANSKQMLKQFPGVVLLPETNYSAVSIILRNWLLDNHVVPRDLDVQSLAYVFRGYSFGIIKETLSRFMTADRIVKIAAYGLSLDEIYNYFLEDGVEKVDYNRYLKWYSDKTHWGKKEKKLLTEQREYQALVQEWAEKAKKKKKKPKNVLSDTSMNVDE